MEPGKKLQKLSDDEESFDTQTYQQAMGCLTYASTATRPDIAAAVGTLSRYMSNPSKDHWIAVKRTLRYLKGTLNYGLRFSDSENDKVVLLMQIGQVMSIHAVQHLVMFFKLGALL